MVPETPMAPEAPMAPAPEMAIVLQAASFSVTLWLLVDMSEHGDSVIPRPRLEADAPPR